MTGSRLLLLSCSDRKVPRAEGPALDIYDGPAYRTLRRRWCQLPGEVVVRIVSAKYGLIEPGTSIQTYDRRLDPVRDRTLLAAAAAALATLHDEHRFQAVFLGMGRDYAQAVPDGLFATAKVTNASGPPGTRVRQMIDWLWDGRCSS